MICRFCKTQLKSKIVDPELLDEFHCNNCIITTLLDRDTEEIYYELFFINNWTIELYYYEKELHIYNNKVTYRPELTDYILNIFSTNNMLELKPKMEKAIKKIKNYSILS